MVRAAAVLSVVLAGATAARAGDDLVTWRPGNGTWYTLAAAANYTPSAATATQWGNQAAGDIPMMGDIDGDGTRDLILWRASTGTWYWLTSSTGYAAAAAGSRKWGSAGLGDVPMLADVDGDGRADLTVWRASTGTWMWLTSSSGYAGGGSKQWGNGALGDQPLVADFDGDERSDLAVWRATTGSWYWLTSSSGYNYATAGQIQWGNKALGDVPMTADLEGDGRADLIVWRASTGTWYWLTSSTHYSYAAGGLKQWGNRSLGDTPVVGDFDRDGRADLTVWRASTATWYWLTSISGYALSGGAKWGSPGDVALVGSRFRTPTPVAAPTPTPTPPPTAAPPPPVTSPNGVELRVLQWNTHHGGYGTDNVYSPDRLATWAAAWRPDVIMFNEIEKNNSWGNQDQPEVYKSLLQQKTGKTWYYVFAQEFGQWSAAGKGNLILSTYPITYSDRYELLHNADRSLAMASITVNGAGITLVSTHLDPYDQALRLAQATEVTTWAAPQPENRILAGDMNAWPDQTSIAQFNKSYNDSWAVAAAQGTATAFSGNNGETKSGRIDYIFSSKNAANLTVKSSQVFDTRDAAGVTPSDHRPVLTTFIVR